VIIGAGVGAGGQVVPDGAGGGGVYVNDTFFSSLAPNEDALVAFVQVLDGDAAELAGTDTGIYQHQNDGFVTKGGGTGVAAGAFARAGVGFGLVAGGEHGLDVVSGVGFDGGLFGVGAFDFLDNVMLDKTLIGGPGPQGAQASVVVEEGLFAEVVAGCEEGTDLVGSDGGEGWISAQELLEFAEGVGVISDGMGR